MRMRKLGQSGLFVSELCLGTMTFGGTSGIWGQVGKLGQDEADALVKTALDAGVNFLDTANTYADGRSEEILGQVLRNLGVARDDVVIATKVAAPVGQGQNMRGGSRQHIMHQCRASLGRLGLDHVDLYQIHEFDRATPIEETLEALDTLVRAGDVRYVGLSNWAAWQIMKAVGISQMRQLSPIISMQAYYSLVGRDVEREIAPLLTAERIGMMVWSPLAGGFLTGKYSDGDDSKGGRRSELDFPPIDQGRGDALIPVLIEIAARHGHSPAQIALAWLLRQPVVTSVIVGAKRVDQLEENLQVTDVELTDEDLSALDDVSKLTIEYPNWLLNQPEGQDT